MNTGFFNRYVITIKIKVLFAEKVICAQRPAEGVSVNHTSIQKSNPGRAVQRRSVTAHQASRRNRQKAAGCLSRAKARAEGGTVFTLRVDAVITCPEEVIQSASCWSWNY